MIQILALNPFIGVIIAFFAQLGVIIMLLLDAPNWTPSPQTKKWWFKQIAVGFFTSLYLLITFLLLDIGLTWILGSWSLSDWRWQIPNVSLLLLTGFIYIYFIIWKSKTRFANLALFIIDSITLVSIIHFYPSRFEIMSIPLSQGLGLVLPLLLIMNFIVLIIINYKLVKSTQSAQKIYNVKQILIGSILLWFLLFIQTAILYNGFSILYSI